MKAILLKTEHLVLREFEECDLPGIYEYAQDPEVFRYQEFGPFTENETKAHLQTMIAYRQESPRVHYELAVVLKESSRLIGNCGLHISNPSNREAWVNCILKHQCWNQGYAAEITLALQEFGFKELKLHRIFATCASTNRWSERVLNKTGFKLEGCLRDHNLIHGQWRDVLLYSILEGEWRASQE